MIGHGERARRSFKRRVTPMRKTNRRRERRNNITNRSSSAPVKPCTKYCVHDNTTVVSSYTRRRVEEKRDDSPSAGRWRTVLIILLNTFTTMIDHRETRRSRQTTIRDRPGGGSRVRIRFIQSNHIMHTQTHARCSGIYLRYHTAAAVDND